MAPELRGKEGGRRVCHGCSAVTGAPLAEWGLPAAPTRAPLEALRAGEVDQVELAAADLAVAAALISSVTGRPAPKRTVFFGEVALSAELRQVAQSDARLKEAAKLGFENAVMPRSRKASAKHAEINLSQPQTMSDLIDIMGGMN